MEWSRTELALRSARRWSRRIERLARWTADPTGYPTAPISADPDRFAERWWSGSAPARRCGGDPRLEAGKLQNLALACAAIDGRELRPDRGFSFWRLVGRPSRARGFAVGAEVRAGCVVPTPGGGLCLVSNLVFRAAAELGWAIDERAGHTLTWTAGDDSPDATVAWPDVDLRVTPPSQALISLALRGGDLELVIRGVEPAPERCAIESEPIISSDVVVVRALWRRRGDGDRELLGRDRKRILRPEQRGVNCLSCDESDCRGRPRDLEAR